MALDEVVAIERVFAEASSRVILTCLVALWR